MGEFEHTKPFILEFKKAKPEYRIIVLFFSPSGFDNIRSFTDIDLILYAPHEWILPMWRFFNKIKPKAWIIAKHDVWPNQVWFARFFRTPVFLINASLYERSARMWPLTINFYRNIYQNFTRILTISEADKRYFNQLVDENKLVVVGDTKFDQVVFRREQSKKINFIAPEILNNHWVFVAGSTWPEDQYYLITAINSLHQKYPEILTIICPHEPTDHHLTELQNKIGMKKTILLSDLASIEQQSYILVDRIGVLANLYGLGKAAYVGGSFKQNVHNVLEPAVYKIPVLFGPVNRNSHEAQLLKTSRGGWEVHSSADIINILEKFILNDIHRQESGLNAYKVVDKNRGATKRTVKNILSFL
jgi:3-deoxy-D-manno-octulosonic-acid transferase